MELFFSIKWCSVLLIWLLFAPTQSLLKATENIINVNRGEVVQVHMEIVKERAGVQGLAGDEAVQDEGN